MSIYFNGWLGLRDRGAEIVDAGYVRLPITLTWDSPTEVRAQDGGTIGPFANVAGFVTSYVLYDQATGGNALIEIPNEPGTPYVAGQTISFPHGYLRLFPLWVFGADYRVSLTGQAGARLGGAALTALSALQVVGGVLSADPIAVLANPAALPTSPGTPNTLWCNGGLVSVS